MINFRNFFEFRKSNNGKPGENDAAGDESTNTGIIFLNDIELAFMKASHNYVILFLRNLRLNSKSKLQKTLNLPE